MTGIKIAILICIAAVLYLMVVETRKDNDSNDI